MIQFENVKIIYPLMQFNTHSLRARFSYELKKWMRLPATDPRKFVCGLDEVSFVINDGEKVGVIGHNGAGKTTLLRTLSGIYPPKSGKVSIHGQVNSLIDTTLGMDLECNGIKNIILKLVYNGKTFSQAKQVVEDIAEFSQLGDAIYNPLYTYSTGMVLRLAFAIATFEIPEILIMDEIIGAGDEKFKTIAQAKIDEIINTSRICIISSHDLSAIRKFCTRCILLAKGKIIADGEVESVVDRYLSISAF